MRNKTVRSLLATPSYILVRGPSRLNLGWHWCNGSEFFLTAYRSWMRWCEWAAWSVNPENCSQNRNANHPYNVQMTATYKFVDTVAIYNQNVRSNRLEMEKRRRKKDEKKGATIITLLYGRSFNFVIFCSSMRIWIAGHAIISEKRSDCTRKHALRRVHIAITKEPYVH